MTIRADSRLMTGVLLAVLGATGTAVAEDSPDTKVDATTGEEPTGLPADPIDEVHFGVGVRIRNVRGPSGMIELFVERAAGGSSNLGLGVELIRRKGNSELQLGIEFEHITPGEGVWIAKGDNVALGDEADYLLDPEHAPENKKVGWITAEFTYMRHTPLTKQIALRYGGGLGIGVVTSALYRLDVACVGATNDNPEPGCVPTRFGGTGVERGPVEYDLPPVFPVINIIGGVQFRPTDKLTVNIEGGIRTFPFFGISSAFFF